MDYLKTNWSQKIQSNPVANKILNSNKADLRTVYIHDATRYTGKYLDYDNRDSVRGLVDKSGWNEFVDRYDTEREIKQKIKRRRQYLTKVDMRRAKDGKAAAKRPSLAEGYGILPRYFYEYDENEDQADVTLPDYWANTYVEDFINIDHPKLRPCYVSALGSNPVGIKPPSVFFSDV